MKARQLYTQRQKEKNGEVADVLVYEPFPNQFKVQVIYIIRDAIGNEAECARRKLAFSFYKDIVTTLCREYGLFFLNDKYDFTEENYIGELSNFFMKAQDSSRILDIIELTFQKIITISSVRNFQSPGYHSYNDTAAITELNHRFKEHGLGYRFEGAELLRIDSEVLHAEVVKPALALLHAPWLKGADDEFRSAHEHFRHNRYKEAITDCLKAFESTMKAIATKRNWAFDPNSQAKWLIALMIDNKLIDPFWNSHFSGLRVSLESSIPTVRNKQGAHGQGAEIVDVPEHVAAFTLHQTAAALVFLMEAEKALN